jgi:hypothetical protein
MRGCGWRDHAVSIIQSTFHNFVKKSGAKISGAKYCKKCIFLLKFFSYYFYMITCYLVNCKSP